METVPFISSFVQTILKKTVTLSGRTIIWDAFRGQIKDHLWIGIGTPREGHLVDWRYFDHMHNQIYDLLVQGGIPALLLFAAVLLVVGYQLTKHRNTFAVKIMVAGMAGLLVMCIPEVCRHGSIFLLFPLAYYAPQIEAICIRKEA